MKEYLTKRDRNYQFKKSKDLVLTILSTEEIKKIGKRLEVGRKDEQRTKT